MPSALSKVLGVVLLLAIATKSSMAAGCMACTLITTLLQRAAIAHGNNVEKAMIAMCDSILPVSAFPGSILNGPCRNLLLKNAVEAQEDLDNNVKPEVICATRMSACDDTPHCKLFDQWPVAEDQFDYKLNNHMKSKQNKTAPTSNIPTFANKDEQNLHNNFMLFVYERLTVLMGLGKDDRDPHTGSLTIEEHRRFLDARKAATTLGYDAMFDVISKYTGLPIDNVDGSIYNEASFTLSTSKKALYVQEILSSIMNNQQPITNNKVQEIKSHSNRFISEIKAKLSNVKSDINIAELAAQLMTPRITSPFDEILHYPIPDFDNDHFGGANLYRGIDWRGKDCNDNDKDVYPGRKVNPSTDPIDYNCNGIYGVDPATNLSHKKKYCENTQQYGLVVIGDSAVAHMALPGRWLNPKASPNNAWDDVLKVLLHEGDWPQCSAYTGISKAFCPDTQRPDLHVKSLYERMYERNRCMFRDYQNIGVNGNNMMMTQFQPGGHNTVKFVNRDNTLDHPAIVFISLVGNDICSKSPHTSSMTKPTDYGAALQNTLKYLDNILPAGSHVIVGGFVDGRLLYRSLKNAVHPIGVSYDRLYDFFNCLSSSPCAGWLNTDETVRDAATLHATMLSNFAKTIMKSTSYKNFQGHYMNTMEMYNEIFAEYEVQGGNPADLVESVDGFHPSATTQALLADKLWVYLQSIISIPVNPYNNVINQIFKDQGGYY